MEKYKPGYLGQVMPVYDQNKMGDFITNKFDAFSKVYDACKNSSENIKGISLSESTMNDDSLSIKVLTDSQTMNDIIKENENNLNVTIVGDVITANL